MSLLVSSVSFKIAPDALRATGHMGWVRCRIGDLHVDRIAVRRTLAGRLRLAFPEHRDAGGRTHAIVRGFDRRTQRDIEIQLLDELHRQGHLP